MTLHQYAMIAVMFAVVVLLRTVPFLLFSGKRKVPAWLLYLGNVLTAAVIAMLVVYSLYSNLEYTTLGAGRLIPGLLASAVTVILHWFIKNPLVSIISGTAVFMFLIQFMA
ncbi:MAG: branched-chain amino acid transporter AzlD [Lentisphaerae bacterium]|nr:branched-chain amino acid transporter AzlD [Lentisphaerota bacterium]